MMNNQRTHSRKFGYMGKVLWVDLTNGKISEEIIQDEYYEKYLSGYGLASKLIFDRQKPGVDPLGPDNIFGLMSGLLTCTGALMTGRWMAVGKSPLTGTWGDANCGGYFAAAIKETGYDGFFFTGISPKPVYLLIDGDKKTLVSAADLWGKDTSYTDDHLRKKYGKNFKVACIGPAGENQALMAGVVTDKGRLAARSGLGAVMGSKRLKAVCIHGDVSTQIFNVEAISNRSGEYLENVFFDEDSARLRKYGTSAYVSYFAEIGESPVKNWKGAGETDFPASMADKISEDNVIQYETEKYGCHSCPIRCGGIMEVKGGPYPLSEAHKPEYETLCAFGTMILCNDVRLVIKVNDMLNRAGMDTISCGSVVSWAFEAFEHGVLTIEDTDGLELKWGNKQAAVDLVQKIIDADGIGKRLMNGVKQAAEYFDSRKHKGSISYAANAGGQDLPMHDPRVSGDQNLGLGVAYEAEPTPGRHTSSLDACDKYRKSNDNLRKLYPRPFGRKDAGFGEGKEFRDASCMMDLINGLGMCAFAFSGGMVPPFVEWINAATGWNKDFEEYLKIGRRIKTVRHSFNVREGITPKDTLMTDRAKGIPPLEVGPDAENTPPVEKAKRSYYKAMGFDPDTAFPLKETLHELGLDDIIKQLYPEDNKR